MNHTRGEPLPSIDLPYRTKINAEPASIEEAKTERHQLVELVQQLEERMRDPGAWERLEARRIKRILVQKRLSFLKDWIKHQNVRAAIENTTVICGGDLDDPVGLVAALRNIILRERAAGRLEWGEDGTDRVVLNAATAYVQLMARERAELTK